MDAKLDIITTFLINILVCNLIIYQFIKSQ